MFLDTRTAHNLAGVHHDLAAVAIETLRTTNTRFIITEGLRTEDRQRQLVRSGASQTMNSRHLTGHAFDVAALVDGDVRWDWPLYERIAEDMKASAEALGVAIEWGGDWTFRDGPHFQLPWSVSAAPEPDEETHDCRRMVLKQGAKGPCVAALQMKLNNWMKATSAVSAQLVQDGDFGPSTRSTLYSFQVNHMLLPDRIVGPKTWDKLEQYL